MFDIHIHIIPEVDDGAWTMEMSLEMLKMAYMQGVRSIMATSHSSAFEWDAQTVHENFALLQTRWLEYVNADKYFQLYVGDEALSFYMGCELHCTKWNMRKVLENLRKKRLPSLNGTKYVMTEFAPLVDVEQALEIVDLLRGEGWIPVIAHVERYEHLRNDEVAALLLQKGCLFQVNAYSLSREMDLEIKNWARHLLEQKKVTFLGSDAHRTTHRPPDVKDGIAYIYEHCEKTYADAVVFGNAQRLLV